MKFKLGSDPELMLIDKNNNLKSAIGIINGTKDEPFMLTKGMAQYDNVNAEIGIMPASSEDEWVENHAQTLKELDKLIGNLKMICLASAQFPASELNTPQAKLFACDPDFNAYTLDVNFVPPDAPKKRLRTCGGHIHVGTKKLEEFDSKITFTKTMDIFLGVPSVLLDKDKSSKARRKLYGKAGAHRPKEYGLEYRTLGNFWISHPKLTRLMYKLTRDAINAFENKYTVGLDWENNVVDIINKSAKTRAKKLISDFVLKLCKDDTVSLFKTCVDMPLADIYSWRKIW